MSLLAFLHEEDRALILTDTLATTTQGEPLTFQTKAWVIPHLNMAVAITGLANFGASWNDFLCSSFVARDIEMVDQLATEQLQILWRDMLAENKAESDGFTSTIYHFGFPEGSDQLVRFVYRSRQNFASERWIEPGMGVKPEPSGALTVPEDFDEWIDLARQVRAEQDALPVTERIHIGGELYLLVLENRRSLVMRLHRFDDYEQAWTAMCAGLRREEQAE